MCVNLPAADLSCVVILKNFRDERHCSGSSSASSLGQSNQEENPLLTFNPSISIWNFPWTPHEHRYLTSSWVTVPPGWRTEPRLTWTVCSHPLGPCQWWRCCVPVSASGFWTLLPWTRACSPGWPSADSLRTWALRCTWPPSLWTWTWETYQPVWNRKDVSHACSVDEDLICRLPTASDAMFVKHISNISDSPWQSGPPSEDDRPAPFWSEQPARPGCPAVGKWKTLIS